MKKVSALLIATLIFSITATLVLASHTASISVIPDKWGIGEEADVTMTITNTAGDGIVEFEVLIPETVDEEPIYIIEEISKPGGWEYITTHKDGQFPYKIRWYTTGTGISEGESLNFGFRAKAPDIKSEYEWSWKTTDTNDVSYTRTFKTETTLAPVHHFILTNEPETIKADETFTIGVSVRDATDKVKTDYTGIIKFTSTDSKAILPEDYTFKIGDTGFKKFSIKYRSAGNQTVTITDATAGISETSDKTMVNPGKAVSIKISPDGYTVSSENSIEFTGMALDKFDNQFDVTEETLWDIDDEAGGDWTENEYTAEIEGVWTVTGTYTGLVDGTILNVGPVEVTPTLPEEEIIPEIPEITPEVEPLVITSLDQITIAPGSNDTMVLSVDNNEETRVTQVTVSVEGIPSEWIEVFPSTVDIEGKGSRSFLITISVPENETETKEITFTVNTTEGLTASKDVTLKIGTLPITGFPLSVENLLPAGIILIAVAAIILSVWKVWFSKPKKS
jgi:uncharacterized protein YcnI